MTSIASDAEFTCPIQRVERGELGAGDLPDAEWATWAEASWRRQRALVVRARRAAKELAEYEGKLWAGDADGRDLPTSPPSWWRPGRGDSQPRPLGPPADDRPQASGNPVFL